MPVAIMADKCVAPGVHMHSLALAGARFLLQEQGFLGVNQIVGTYSSSAVSMLIRVVCQALIFRLKVSEFCG